MYRYVITKKVASIISYGLRHSAIIEAIDIKTNESEIYASIASTDVTMVDDWIQEQQNKFQGATFIDNNIP